MKWLLLSQALIALAALNSDPILNADELTWWDIKKTAEPLFDAVRDDSLRLRKIDLDDNAIHTCYEYEHRKLQNTRLGLVEVNRTGTFCYPAVVITGVRKCSTSAFYGLLGSLPGSVKMIYKENCPYVGERSIVEYFESLPEFVSPGGLIIDGCVDVQGNLKMREILRYPTTFYLLIIRDFSNWVWSAYNYWCSQSFDIVCDEAGTRWTMVRQHNRSVDGFHQIVQNNVEGRVIPSPLDFNNTCVKASHFYESYVGRLRAAFIPDKAFMVLTSEELESRPELFWLKFAVATGLPTRHPGIKEFADFRYNVQSIEAWFRHGFHPEESKIQSSKHKPGLYKISKYKPLMQQTRQLLDACWRDDCLWAVNVTGYPYAACAVNSQDLNAMQIKLSMSANQQNFSGFLNEEIRTCDNRLAAHSLEASTILPRTLILSAGDTLNQLMALLVNRMTKQNAVFVLNAASGKWCESGLATAHIVAAGIDTIAAIELTSLSTYEVSFQSVGGKKEGSLTNDCQNVKERFDRVVVIKDDTLLPVWKEFLANMSIDAGTFGGSRGLSWQDWDDTALAAMSQEASHDRVLAKLSSESSLLLELDFVFSGPSKHTNLRRILSFLGYSDSPDDVLRCSFAVCFASLRQSFQLHTLFENHRLMKDRLEWIYSSDAVVCKRREILANLYGSNSSHGFYKNVKCPSAAHATATASLISSSSSSSSSSSPSSAFRHQSLRTCRKRYGQRDYLSVEQRRQPVALVAMPSDKLLSTRLLLEYATSYLTGSVKTNFSLLKTFPAEQYCGQRMPIVYTYPPDLTVKNAKLSGIPTLSLNQAGKEQCANGLVRGFGRSIILIEDPYLSIWANYSSLLMNTTHASNYATAYNTEITMGHRASDRSNATAIETAAAATATAMAAIKRLASAYTLESLLGHVAAKNVVELFAPSEYLIISYEYLFHAETRKDAIARVEAFINFPLAVTDEARYCAHLLVGSAPQTLAIGAAVRSLHHQHRHLLCVMKQTLDSHGFLPYLNATLFHDVACRHRNQGSVFTEPTS